MQILYCMWLAGQCHTVCANTKTRGLPGDVVDLSWPIAPLVYEPKWKSCGVSANENSCAHHVTWSPSKLCRSNFIFNIWLKLSLIISSLKLLYFVGIIVHINGASTIIVDSIAIFFIRRPFGTHTHMYDIFMLMCSLLRSIKCAFRHVAQHV